VPRVMPASTRRPLLAAGLLLALLAALAATSTSAASAAAAAAAAGPATQDDQGRAGRYCPPRIGTRCEPSFLRSVSVMASYL